MNILKMGFLLAGSLFTASCQTIGTPNPEVLVFTPGLFPYSNIERAEGTHSNGRLKRQVIATYTSSLNALVVFNSLSSSSVFTYSPKKTHFWIKNVKSFKGKNLVYGKEEEITTSLGKVVYEYVTFDNTQCAHFVKPHRRHQNDDMGRYSSYLAGYICQSPNKVLEDKTVAAFLNQVSIKRKNQITIDEAGIKPAPLNPSTLNNDGVAGHKDDYTIKDSVDYSGLNKMRDDGVKNRLIELKKLLDAGLITEEEAAKKRQEILDGI